MTNLPLSKDLKNLIPNINQCMSGGMVLLLNQTGIYRELYVLKENMIFFCTLLSLKRLLSILRRDNYLVH